MPRILGVDIPVSKKIYIALTYIYGIGPTRAKKILSQAQISSDIKASDLNDEQISKLSSIIEDSYQIEGNLRRNIAMSVKRLQIIGAYRGIRHSRGLPVRGQRTKTNARTRKGKKKTIGAIRDKSQRKMAR